jgi:putative DNA primase/helicase
MNVMTGNLADRCRGRWPEIMTRLGLLSADALRGKDVPCVKCGGRDRFRFTDQGFGRWFCRGCAHGGDGVRLVQAIKGCDFLEAKQLIEGALGGGSAPSAGLGKGNGAGAGASHGAPRDPLKTWKHGAPILGTVADVYLRGRGIALNAIEALALRFKPKLWHWPSRTEWPCMVALVRLHDGTELTTHQTFLTEDGSGKAQLLGDKVRLFVHCDSIAGGAVWFGAPDPEHEFIVAEGIESALSAMRLCRARAGAAALSAGGIRRLILPPEARRIRVFADHDPGNQGLAAAVMGCARWRAEAREVAISRATEVGCDANDVLMQRNGR